MSTKFTFTRGGRDSFESLPLFAFTLPYTIDTSWFQNTLDPDALLSKTIDSFIIILLSCLDSYKHKITILNKDDYEYYNYTYNFYLEEGIFFMDVFSSGKLISSGSVLEFLKGYEI